MTSAVIEWRSGYGERSTFPTHMTFLRQRVTVDGCTQGQVVMVGTVRFWPYNYQWHMCSPSQEMSVQLCMSTAITVPKFQVSVAYL